MDPENTLIMTLDTGPVTIKLRPDLAPGHVAVLKVSDKAPMIRPGRRTRLAAGGT